MPLGLDTSLLPTWLVCIFTTTKLWIVVLGSKNKIMSWNPLNPTQSSTPHPARKPGERERVTERWGGRPSCLCCLLHTTS
ncbi:hypothetical protein F4809DRAFT_467180 [Biscogniauxia mediterranea]|nr:hypothetical protein F4809DRAFT_467180 [Biscogniauxia mediterranea]